MFFKLVCLCWLAAAGFSMPSPGLTTESELNINKNKNEETKLEKQAPDYTITRGIAVLPLIQKQKSLIPLGRPPKYYVSYQAYPVTLQETLVKLNDSDKLRTSVGQEGIYNLNEQSGRLRIFGWLFGRPSYHDYNYDYSHSRNPVNQMTTSTSYSHHSESSYPMSPMYSSHSRYPQSSMMVEECEEFYDPITGDIVEECHIIH